MLNTTIFSYLKYLIEFPLHFVLYLQFQANEQDSNLCSNKNIFMFTQRVLFVFSRLFVVCLEMILLESIEWYWKQQVIAAPLVPALFYAYLHCSCQFSVLFMAYFFCAKLTHQLYFKKNISFIQFSVSYCRQDETHLLVEFPLAGICAASIVFTVIRSN